MDSLFDKGSLGDAFAHRLGEELPTAVDKVTRDDLLADNDDDLIAELVAEYEIAPLILHEDQMRVSPPVEIKMQVPAYGGWDYDPRSGRSVRVDAWRLVFTVPFSGEKDLFNFRASTSTSAQGNVGKGVLSFVYEVREIDAERQRAEFERDLSQVRKNLDWIDAEVTIFNERLPDRVRAAVAQRRERVLAAEGAVAALGVPVRRRDDASALSVPLKRKKAVPTRKPKSATRSKSRVVDPEWEVKPEAYEEILSVIRQMADVLERSPHAFRNADEGTLRTLLLVGLNAQFEGGASAETFNYEGKTDILIVHEGRVVFVAECKVWDGPAALLDALDQIRGYLTWRDTKAAIVIFVRAKNFSSIVEKVVPTVEGHEGWKKTLGQTGETEYRFVVTHKDDEERAITLTVMLFAVPTPAESA